MKIVWNFIWRIFTGKMKKLSEMAGGMKKDKIILVFLVGILLLVIAIPIDQKEEKTVNSEVLEEAVTDEVNISTNAALLEAQLEQVLSQMEGIGQVQSMITLEPFIDEQDIPEVRGVLILAESGDDPVEVLKIQETVMTLFQIDAHRIKVMKLK